MSDEVSLKEILGDVIKETAKKEEDGGDLRVKDILELIKALQQMRSLQAQPTPQIPAQPQGSKTPEERAEIMWRYISTIVKQFGEQFPDMTVREVAEKIDQLKSVAMPQLRQIAKSF